MASSSPTARASVALTSPISGAVMGLGFFTKAMNVLAKEDRSGSAIHAITPQSRCFQPLLAEAQTIRQIRLAKEVISAAVPHYQKVRSKIGGPLRFRKHRDSMPLLECWRGQAGLRRTKGVTLSRAGAALSLIRSVSVSPVDLGAKENLLAIQATPEGLYFAMSDGSGRTYTHHTPRKALLDPKFIHRLVSQIARSVRALIVHADPKLNGAPAEALRQVYRKVRRRKAESAVALKKVGSVDRSHLLCPCCGLLVRGSRPCACGATHSQGILDAYAILEAGRDTLGAVAFLQQGAPWPQSNDAPEGDAPFRTTADKDDDDDDSNPTAEPSRSVSPGVCQDRKPSLKAVAVGRDAHTDCQFPAQKPVGTLPSQQRVESRPVAAITPPQDPTRLEVELLPSGFVDASINPSDVPQKTRSECLAGATSSHTTGSQEPDPCSPVEATFNHPRLHPWWERLGMAAMPQKARLIDIMDLASEYCGHEMAFYIKEGAVSLLPMEWGLLGVNNTADTRIRLCGLLYKDIMASVAVNFPKH